MLTSKEEKRQFSRKLYEKEEDEILRFKAFVLCILFTSLIFIIFFISGCSSSGSEKLNYGEMLKSDAKIGLKGKYAEDYKRFTIIRGSLYKYSVNPQNIKHLGTVMGATEATMFPEDYELMRFDRLENLSAAMRKEIISQPMLAITLRKRDVLNHIYNAVLKPLELNAEKSKQVNPQDALAINNLINLLDNLTENYAILADNSVDLNSAQAQQTFLNIQAVFGEMQKMELYKAANRP